jgi:1,3-beta-glucan synthase
MSGYPNHQAYDDGYGHQQGNTDSYYDNEHGQYYDNGGYDAHGGQGGHGAAQDGYYDES